MKIMLLFAGSFLFVYSYAQKNKQPPCFLPEASQFNFWIGDWNLTWSDTLHGTNRVEKIFGNCTVQENFTDPNTHYFGKSWSVYNTNYKTWEQTWVDSQGGFIYLTGGMKADSMILVTNEKNVPVQISRTGKMINRMVYYHITPSSFDWSWQSSTDGGISWQSNWLIHYKRKE